MSFSPGSLVPDAVSQSVGGGQRGQRREVVSEKINCLTHKFVLLHVVPVSPPEMRDDSAIRNRRDQTCAVRNCMSLESFLILRNPTVRAVRRSQEYSSFHRSAVALLQHVLAKVHYATRTSRPHNFATTNGLLSSKARRPAGDEDMFSLASL